MLQQGVFVYFPSMGCWFQSGNDDKPSEIGTIFRQSRSMVGGSSPGFVGVLGIQPAISSIIYEGIVICKANSHRT